MENIVTIKLNLDGNIKNLSDEQLGKFIRLAIKVAEEEQKEEQKDELFYFIKSN